MGKFLKEQNLIAIISEGQNREANMYSVCVCELVRLAQMLLC